MAWPDRPERGSVEDWFRELVGLRPRHTGPPPPTVVLGLHGAVPGALVRLGAALLLAGTLLLVDGSPLTITIAAAGAVAVAWRPHWPVAQLATLVVAVVVLAGPDLLGAGLLTQAGGSGLLRVCGLVLGIHLMLRVAAMAARTTWRSVVEGSVVTGMLRSVLATQVLVQAVLLAVVWLRTGLGGVVAGQEWLRLLAVAAVVGVVVLVVPRGWVRSRSDR